MAHANWSLLERMFDQLGIKPLVAVVPENHDPVLEVDDEDSDFWQRIRNWQAKGWCIAMHGYQHVFNAVDRRKLVLPFYDRSEFAGLSLSEQADKIRAAWAVFQSHGITPTVWIAPAHCFDHLTMKALLQETPIRVISDGIALNPYHVDGFLWLPQQLWALKPRPFGLWTVCLHPNSMSQSDIDQLAAQLASPYYRERITAVDDVARCMRQRNLVDRLYAVYFWNRGRVFSMLNTVRGWIRRHL